MNIEFKTDPDEPFDTAALQILDQLYRGGKITRPLYAQHVTATMNKILQVVTVQGMRPRLIVELDPISHEPVRCYTSLRELKQSWIEREQYACAIWYRLCDKSKTMTMDETKRLFANNLPALTKIGLRKVGCLAQPTIDRITRRNKLLRAL